MLATNKEKRHNDVIPEKMSSVYRAADYYNGDLFVFDKGTLYQQPGHVDDFWATVWLSPCENLLAYTKFTLIVSKVQIKDIWCFFSHIL